MKVALLVLMNAVYMAQAYPAHASCQLQWDFAGMTCDKVMNKIVNQIDAWSGEELCMTGTDQVNEKCLYTLTYRDAGYLEATHETPEKHYVDDLFMTFTPDTTGKFGGQWFGMVWSVFLRGKLDILSDNIVV